MIDICSQQLRNIRTNIVCYIYIRGNKKEGGTCAYFIFYFYPGQFLTVKRMQ